MRTRVCVSGWEVSIAAVALRSPSCVRAHLPYPARPPRPPFIGHTGRRPLAKSGQPCFARRFLRDAVGTGGLEGRQQAAILAHPHHVVAAALEHYGARQNSVRGSKRAGASVTPSMSAGRRRDGAGGRLAAPVADGWREAPATTGWSGGAWRGGGGGGARAPASAEQRRRPAAGRRRRRAGLHMHTAHPPPSMKTCGTEVTPLIDCRICCASPLRLSPMLSSS